MPVAIPSTTPTKVNPHTEFQKLNCQKKLWVVITTLVVSIFTLGIAGYATFSHLVKKWSHKKTSPTLVKTDQIKEKIAPTFFENFRKLEQHYEEAKLGIKNKDLPLAIHKLTECLKYSSDAIQKKNIQQDIDCLNVLKKWVNNHPEALDFDEKTLQEPFTKWQMAAEKQNQILAPLGNFIYIQFFDPSSVGEYYDKPLEEPLGDSLKQSFSFDWEKDELVAIYKKTSTVSLCRETLKNLSRFTFSKKYLSSPFPEVFYQWCVKQEHRLKELPQKITEKLKNIRADIGELYPHNLISNWIESVDKLLKLFSNPEEMKENSDPFLLHLQEATKNGLDQKSAKSLLNHHFYLNLEKLALGYEQDLKKIITDNPHAHEPFILKLLQNRHYKPAMDILKSMLNLIPDQVEIIHLQISILSTMQKKMEELPPSIDLDKRKASLLPFLSKMEEDFEELYHLTDQILKREKYLNPISIIKKLIDGSITSLDNLPAEISQHLSKELIANRIDQRDFVKPCLRDEFLMVWTVEALEAHFHKQVAEFFEHLLEEYKKKIINTTNATQNPIQPYPKCKSELRKKEQDDLLAFPLQRVVLENISIFPIQDPEFNLDPLNSLDKLYNPVFTPKIKRNIRAFFCLYHSFESLNKFRWEIPQRMFDIALAEFDDLKNTLESRNLEIRTFYERDARILNVCELLELSLLDINNFSFQIFDAAILNTYPTNEVMKNTLNRARNQLFQWRNSLEKRKKLITSLHEWIRMYVPADSSPIQQIILLKLTKFEKTLQDKKKDPALLNKLTVIQEAEEINAQLQQITFFEILPSELNREKKYTLFNFNFLLKNDFQKVKAELASENIPQILNKIESHIALFKINELIDEYIRKV